MSDAQELPPHRTQRISLSKAQLRTELGAELLSLCESVTTDGKLDPAEATALREWLNDAKAADLPAASYLKEVVARVLADGVVTAEECREVYKAVEAVLPPEVRRQAATARRGVESAERDATRASRTEAREKEREERKRNAPIGSANFMVAGIRYEGRPAIIERYAKVDGAVRLIRDLGNRHSRHAIVVELDNGRRIGFVPEQDAEWMAPLIDQGSKSTGVITKILTGGRSPIPVVQAYLFRADADIEQNVQSRDSAPPPVSSRSSSSLIGWLFLIVMLVALAFAFAS